MAFLTPLRYPGGKGKLSNFVELLFQENNLLDAPYIEPYAGGAGVAITLLFDEFSSHIHINDINRSIFSFWYSVLNETDQLCSMIQSTKVTIEEWKHQQEIQNRINEVTLLELGFSNFFLNRTNHSGIIKGGVIGGKDQDGPFKLDARFNKSDLISRIQRIARYKNRISIYNMDAADFISQVLPDLPARSFLYLDPPYYIKGQGLYENYYNHHDHLSISRLVKTIQQHWIISYDNTEQILQMYNNYRQIIYNLSYSAGDRYKGSEVMFFSENLSIPPIESPVSVDKKRISNNFTLRLGLPSR